MGFRNAGYQLPQGGFGQPLGNLAAQNTVAPQPLTGDHQDRAGVVLTATPDKGDKTVTSRLLTETMQIKAGRQGLTPEVQAPTAIWLY